MGAVRKLAELADQNQDPTELIRSLRTYYHSLHAEDRDQVISLLERIPHGSAPRELIQLYADCQWRSTRFRIIQALATRPDSRTLPFLFKLAMDFQDIPVAEAAIRSLGNTHHTLAARFLTHLYGRAPETLTPAIVGALGQIPDRTLAQEFLASLPAVLKEGKVLLAKNLVLTLGELKVAAALPLLEELLSNRDLERSIRLAALISVGKLARDPAPLLRQEQDLSQDLFEAQLFRSVATQIQFRSQWRLEDYLRRHFESDGGHRALPYELNFFEPADVKEGLRLYATDSLLPRLCDALSRVDFPGVHSWYLELLPLKGVKGESLLKVLASVACHLNAGMASVLQALRPQALADPMGAAFAPWLEAAASSLPDAEPFFRSFFQSEEFRELPESRRILAVNAFLGHALSVLPVPARCQNSGHLLEYVLEHDPSPAVQARVLRGLASLGFASSKARTFLKQHLLEPQLTASCLAYAASCPDKALPLDPGKFPAKQHGDLVRALTARLDPRNPDLKTVPVAFLQSSLAAESPEDVRLETLRFLAKAPAPELLPRVLACLKDSERLQLEAVITLRSYADPSTADAVARLLESPAQSISGRALDTLCAIPGLRAKRLVIDALKANADDMDFCDKVVRCLEPPESGEEYFIAAIDEILTLLPQHPEAEGLISLQDRIRLAADSRKGTPTPPDLRALDQKLEQQLPFYGRFDEPAKSALRAAELPYLHPELYGDSVDKSSSILQYCKAIDLILEKDLGRRILFPKLESSLHEFQNAIHALGLNEALPQAERLIAALGLRNHFVDATFPLHKITVLSASILSGRILNERFRVLDGLRAWAVLLLLFARGPRPLLPLKDRSDDTLVSLCKKLMGLQDVRNPAAHRHTVPKLVALDEVRQEAMTVLRMLEKVLS